MMPFTRRDLEILLDTPEQTDYVVSAYVDLKVRDGFRRFGEVEIDNLARRADLALSEAEARKVLQAAIEPIDRAIAAADPSARGLAVFSGTNRGLLRTVELDVPVENKLVLDEEPYLLPLLEQWYGRPSFLVALVDSHELHLFDAYAGRAEHVEALEKGTPAELQRDKPRFTYKKRFNDTWHEHQHKLTEDEFLKGVAERIAEHFREGSFTGLILLGQPQITSAVRRLLPKQVANLVVDEHPQAMRPHPESKDPGPREEDVEDDVARAMEEWAASERERILNELQQRWEQGHLVANGPTEVLDALQQGRAIEIVFGTDRSQPGARCTDCGYRLGAPTEKCPYCGGKARTISAAQEILRLAMSQRVARVALLDRPDRRAPDPLERAGGVAALLRAEANWAPAGNAEAARR